jgi:hypothetical protein
MNRVSQKETTALSVAVFHLDFRNLVGRKGIEPTMDVLIAISGSHVGSSNTV